MRLEQFNGALDTTVDVPLGTWAAATLLGHARTITNERRHGTHDRGSVGNRNVDLWGAFTELLLLRVVRNLHDSDDARRYIESGLFDPRGGTATKGRPDLEFVDGRTIGVDAKSFNCIRGYKLFAIAASKHDDLRGHCDGYFTAIVPEFGKRAVLAKLVPYADVEEWPRGHLRFEWDDDAGAFKRDKDDAKIPRGNESRHIPIEDFTARYCSARVDLDALREDQYDPKDVEELARDAKLRKSLLQTAPNLKDYI